MSGGDLSRCLEDFGNFRIHVDELVALDGDPGVPQFDAVVHPGPEWFTNDAVDEVTEIAPLESVAFPRDRQGLNHDFMISGIGEDILDGEALVVGHRNGLDLVALEARLRPGHDIPQMYVGDGLEGGQVAAALVGEEAVDLYRKMVRCISNEIITKITVLLNSRSKQTKLRNVDAPFSETGSWAKVPRYLPRLL